MIKSAELALQFQELGNQVFARNKASPVAVMYYSAALSKTPSTDHGLRAALLANRSDCLIHLGNYELASQDAKQAMKAGNAQGSYLYALAELRLGHWAQCTRVCREARTMSSCKPMSACFDDLERQARAKKGFEQSQMAAATSPSVRFGGPKASQTEEEWFQDRTRMSVAGDQIMEWYVQADGDMNKMAKLAGKPLSELNGVVRNLELLSEIPKTQDPTSWTDERSHADWIAGVASELRQQLNGELVKFRSSELLPQIASEWDEAQCKWWCGWIVKQATAPGDWCVSSVDCWNYVPTQWRHKSMRQALLKIAREMDCFEFFIAKCPELSISSLERLSEDPKALLGLAYQCCSDKAPNSTAPNSFLCLLPPCFVRYDAQQGRSKLFDKQAELVLGRGSEGQTFVSQQEVMQRWSALTNFCFYSLMFARCMDEPLTVIVRRKNKSGAFLGSMLVKGTQENRRIAKELRQKARDPSDKSIVRRKTCGYCGGVGDDDKKKCARCGLVYYCDPTCQIADWPQHKGGCKKVSSTAYSSSTIVLPDADILALLRPIVSSTSNASALELQAIFLATHPKIPLSLERLQGLEKKE